MGSKASRENRISLEWLQEQVSNQSEQVVYLRNIQTYYIQNEERERQDLDEQLIDVEEELAILRNRCNDKQQEIDAIISNHLTKDLERMRKKLSEELGEIRTFATTLPTKIKCKYRPVKKNLENDVVRFKDAAENSLISVHVLSTQSVQRQRALRDMSKKIDYIFKNEEIVSPCNCNHRYLCRYSNSEMTLDKNDTATMSNGSVYSIKIMSEPKNAGSAGTSIAGWRGKIRKLFRVKEKV